MQSNAWIISDCQTANQRRQRSPWDSIGPGLFLSLDTEQRSVGLGREAGRASASRPRNRWGNIRWESWSAMLSAPVGPQPPTLTLEVEQRKQWVRGAWKGLWGSGSVEEGKKDFNVIEINPWLPLSGTHRNSWVTLWSMENVPLLSPPTRLLHQRQWPL